MNMIKYMYSINIFLSAILSSPLIIFFYLIKFIIPKELWFRIIKYIIIAMKDPIRRVPGIGWAVELLEYAFISRNNKLMDINELKNTVKQDNIFFLIFPEGTNFGVEKLKTQLLQYNLNDDLKLICNEYTDVLIPKTSGLRTCIKNGNFDKIYTLTICYSKLPSIQTPTLWSAWMGIYPKEILFNIENFKCEKN